MIDVLWPGDRTGGFWFPKAKMAQIREGRVARNEDFQVPHVMHRTCVQPAFGIEFMVGERGFEPPAPASRRQCSTRLSYSPNARNMRATDRLDAGLYLPDFFRARKTGCANVCGNNGPHKKNGGHRARRINMFVSLRRGDDGSPCQCLPGQGRTERLLQVPEPVFHRCRLFDRRTCQWLH